MSSSYVPTEEIKMSVCYCLLASENVLSCIADLKGDIINENIYPYYRIPSTIADTRTMINMTVNIGSIAKNKLSNIILTIWVISSSANMIMKNGQVRTDALANEIIDLLQSCTGKWIGEMELKSNVEGTIDEKYNTRVLQFSLKDIVVDNQCK